MRKWWWNNSEKKWTTWRGKDVLATDLPKTGQWSFGCLHCWHKKLQAMDSAWCLPQEIWCLWSDVDKKGVDRNPPFWLICLHRLCPVTCMALKRFQHRLYNHVFWVAFNQAADMWAHESTKQEKNKTLKWWWQAVILVLWLVMKNRNATEILKLDCVLPDNIW